VPEQQLPAIQRQTRAGTLRVEAAVPGAAGLPEQGELTFVNNTVDTNTGTILLKATFPNTNDVLWPGLFVQASLTLSNLTEATVVPAQAVQAGQNGDFIYVVSPDQTVDARPVVTGINREGMTVIASGLAPGEVVVIDGQLRLIPGGKVTVKESQSPTILTNAVALKP